MFSTTTNFLAVLVVILISNILTIEGGYRSYHGYKVYRIFPKTSTQFSAINDLIAEDKYDFWRLPHSELDSCDVMLSPPEQPEVLSYLERFDISYTILIPDVESVIGAERERWLKRKKSMDWDDYHTWDEVNSWLSTLVATNNLITSQPIGSSYEGREMRVYKVSSGPGNKTGFWIDSTIHAREHITTAVITYVINELVQNSSKYADILDRMDFYFLPFMNPDGYVYTHEVNRLWRKTRSNWSNSSCVGVDGNRNFGHHWGELGGSSNLTCSDGYHGPEPFSEPEARAVRDFILGANITWTTYVTLHSYSQIWMSPWGYTTLPPEDNAQAVQVAEKAVAALYSHFNTTYETGNAGEVLCKCQRTISVFKATWVVGEHQNLYA